MTDIIFTDCPQVLQDSVNRMMETVPGEIIATKKLDSTPYKDKSIIVTTYKVYLQFGVEVCIYRSQITTGMEGGNVLDGDVSSNIINLGDIETIIDSVEWFKKEIFRSLS